MRQITTIMQVVQTFEFDETKITPQEILSLVEEATRQAVSDMVLPSMDRIELEVIPDQNPTIVDL